MTRIDDPRGTLALRLAKRLTVGWRGLSLLVLIAIALLLLGFIAIWAWTVPFK